MHTPATKAMLTAGVLVFQLACGKNPVESSVDGWPLGLTGSLAVVARDPKDPESLEAATYHVSIKSEIEGEWTRLFTGTNGRFCCVPLGRLTAVPDNRTLAFDIVRDDASSSGMNSIWRINADGSADMALYEAGQKPVYSADGWLAYSTYSFKCGFYDGHYQTCGIAVDGEVVIPCASILGAHKTRCEPTVSWFPDSDAMAVAVDSSIVRGSVSAMSAMERLYSDPDGKGLGHVAVAPGGDAIAFIRGLDDTGELWVVNADGSDPLRLTAGYRDARPSWSSDGRIIIFRRRTYDGEGFYLEGSVNAVSADGGTVAELWADDNAAEFLYAHTWIG